MSDTTASNDSGNFSVILTPDPKRHAFDIMVQACVAMLTLSSLLFTALLAFAGGVIGADSLTDKGIVVFAWMAGLCFIVTIVISMRILFVSVTLAQVNEADVSDKAVRIPMLLLSFLFFIGIVTFGLYLFTIRYAIS